MPRKPRIEYAGAIYHAMCRGNRRAAIFRSDRDCEMFLDTLGEAVGRCGWRVHAYVLMGNHYHMLLETPEPNLVAGMRCQRKRGPSYKMMFFDPSTPHRPAV